MRDFVSRAVPAATLSSVSCVGWKPMAIRHPAFEDRRQSIPVAEQLRVPSCTFWISMFFCGFRGYCLQDPAAGNKKPGGARFC